MKNVLLVSKALSPPIHDGSACLVRDVASNLRRYRATVLTKAGRPDGGQPPPVPAEVRTLPLYSPSASFAPALRDQARILSHLLTERRHSLWHFVFAPNPRTSGVIRRLRMLRRTPVVQTVASAPKSFSRVRELLFGDVVVAQSEWTGRQLREHFPGFEPTVIRPSVPTLVTPTGAEQEALRHSLDIPPEAPVVVYPGDLEFSSGAKVVAEVLPALKQRCADAVVVFACREKTARAAEVREELHRRLPPEQVRFAGELPSLLPLLMTADLVLFPVDNLFGKVDLPIALLEAMQLGTPVLSYDYGPLAELRGVRLVPSGDVRQTIRNMLDLLVSPEQHQEVASRQRRFVLNDMTATGVAAAYEAVYDRLLL